MMKACIRRNYGGPDQLNIESVEKPVPKDNEVLVEVFATTVNRTDCANLTAKPFIMRFVLGLFKPRQMILGTDFAGKVVAKGKEVRSFQIEDLVFGFFDIGSASQAEFLCLAEEIVFPMPPDIDFIQAAASLEGAHYAYTFIHKVNLKPGQKVMINGATGAIGSALLQFVRQYEVRITATASTKNIDLIRSLGADKVIDFTKDDFTLDKEKYDYIFDAVGKSTFMRCRSIMSEKGIYISSELGPYSQNIFFTLISLFSRGRKVLFPVPYKVNRTIPYISVLLKKKIFRPVIDRKYPLKEISKAYTYVMSGEKTGNVVLHLKSEIDHEV